MRERNKKPVGNGFHVLGEGAGENGAILYGKPGVLERAAQKPTEPIEIHLPELNPALTDFVGALISNALKKARDARDIPYLWSYTRQAIEEIRSQTQQDLSSLTGNEREETETFLKLISTPEFENQVKAGVLEAAHILFPSREETSRQQPVAVQTQQDTRGGGNKNSLHALDVANKVLNGSVAAAAMISGIVYKSYEQRAPAVMPEMTQANGGSIRTVESTTKLATGTSLSEEVRVSELAEILTRDITAAEVSPVFADRGAGINPYQVYDRMQGVEPARVESVISLNTPIDKPASFEEIAAALLVDWTARAQEENSN